MGAVGFRWGRGNKSSFSRGGKNLTFCTLLLTLFTLSSLSLPRSSSPKKPRQEEVKQKGVLVKKLGSEVKYRFIAKFPWSKGDHMWLCEGEEEEGNVFIHQCSAADFDSSDTVPDPSWKEKRLALEWAARSLYFKMEVDDGVNKYQVTPYGYTQLLREWVHAMTQEMLDLALASEPGRSKEDIWLESVNPGVDISLAEFSANFMGQTDRMFEDIRGAPDLSTIWKRMSDVYYINGAVQVE